MTLYPLPFVEEPWRSPVTSLFEKEGEYSESIQDIQARRKIYIILWSRPTPESAAGYSWRGEKFRKDETPRTGQCRECWICG